MGWGVGGDPGRHKFSRPGVASYRFFGRRLPIFRGRLLCGFTGAGLNVLELVEERESQRESDEIEDRPILAVIEALETRSSSRLSAASSVTPVATASVRAGA